MEARFRTGRRVKVRHLLNPNLYRYRDSVGVVTKAYKDPSGRSFISAEFDGLPPLDGEPESIFDPA